MAKDTSLIIKGIAILMMLFLHLFNGQITDIQPTLQDEYYQPLLYINKLPIEYIITRFCRPVPFFFILSGYGISCLHTKGLLTFKTQLRRLFRIFTAYWITMLIFVSIGHYMGLKLYPESIRTFLLNASSYSNSYNLSMWFLFPYTMICLSSPLILRFIEYKKSYVAALLVTGLLYGVSGYIIMQYIDEIEYHSFTGHFLQYVEYLFPFTCGIILHKTSILQHPKLSILHHNKLLTFTLLAVVIIMKSFFDSQSLDTLYALAFIGLFIYIPLNKHISDVLLILGKYSMGMWMVHMYLSHYLFTDFFYGFRYTVLIYLALILSSLAVSVFINKCNIYIHQIKWNS